MALFDFLKRKKEISAAAKSKADREKAKPAQKARPIEADKKPVVKKEEPKPAKETKKVVSKKRTAGFSYDIVKEPHISERATDLSEKNQYTFKVSKRSSKSEIKKSIEGIYGVDVLSVNIIKIPKKKRRLGRTEGFKKGLTKAVVKIREGQKIEII